MNYVIASLQRSGSTYLSELLARNRVGIPEIDFCATITAEACAFPLALIRGESTEEYLESLFAKRTVNGIFATKIEGDWLEIMQANMKVPTFSIKDMLLKLFPEAKYIFLTRRDRLKQAISHEKAMKDSQWWCVGKESPSESKIQVTVTEIQARLFYILTHEQKWKEFFHESNIQPLHIVYEDLIKYPEQILPRLSEFLGQEIKPIATEKMSLKIQSNKETEELYEEYIKVASRTSNYNLIQEIITGTYCTK